MTVPITLFRGEHAFLSNFRPSPITIDGIRCDSVEHAFQMLKTLDPAERKHIANAPNAAEAKKRGRKATLRKDWENVKVAQMRRCLREKFSDMEMMAREQAAGNDEKGSDK